MIRAALSLAARWLLTIALACSFAVTASAQQWSMPGHSPLGDGGTVEEVATKGFKLKTTGGPGWYVTVLPQTKIILTGKAQPDFLRPKLYVHFPVEVDSGLNVVSPPLKELEIYTPAGKAVVGFIPEGKADGKPVLTPGAGKYDIRATVVDYKDGQLTVAPGAKRITVPVASDCKIDATLGEYRYVQPGDKVKMIGWYTGANKPDFENQRPGNCIAEKLTITAAKPFDAETGLAKKK